MITIPVDTDNNGTDNRISLTHLIVSSNSVKLTPTPAGVPFGIGIIQTAGREDLLIRYGSAIEDLLQGRTEAKFINMDADNFMYVGVNPQEIS